MPTFTNVVEIIVDGTLAETAVLKKIANVYHYRLVAGSVGSRANIASQFLSVINTFALAQQSADYVLNAARCRLLDDATEQYTTITTAGNPGGIALPRLPGDLAIVLPFRCVQRGKQFRGRKHFRGVPSASVLKDELTAGALTAWQAVAAKYLLTFVSDGATYQPCVISRVLSQLRVNPTSIIGSDVNAVLTNKTIGTMRRSKEPTQR